VQFSRADAQVRIENHCPHHACIEVDRPRIVQVLVNLLTKAIDASERHGVVRIDAANHDKIVDIQVRDVGEGIDEEIKAKIFEPFVTTKPPGRGTGLGLAMVYRIVNDHGGNIQIDSNRGEGTVVVLSLPASAPHGEQLASGTTV